MSYNKHKWKAQLEMQSMVWPGLIFLLVFSYLPMYGTVIAFKNYDLLLGVFNSPWVGLEHFKTFFTDPYLGRVVKNTLTLNILGLLIGFPAPIIFALLLNEVTNKKFKGFVQTISYLPYFVSWAVFGGIVISMLSPTNGLFNMILVNIGILHEPFNFMGDPNSFIPTVIVSDIIKGIGWGAILYIAAISGVEQEMYEAATIDGAGRFQKMWRITLPSIMGTIVIMLILNISAILTTDFEKIYVLQNAINLDRSELLDTYLYKIGLQQMQYSYSTAVGLTKSVIALCLVIAANLLSNKITKHGLY